MEEDTFAGKMTTGHEHGMNATRSYIRCWPDESLVLLLSVGSLSHRFLNSLLGLHTLLIPYGIVDG